MGRHMGGSGHLVGGLYEEELRGVHPEQLHEVEDREDEVKQGMPEAAHKVIQRVEHHHWSIRVGIPLWYPTMNNLQ